MGRTLLGLLVKEAPKSSQSESHTSTFPDSYFSVMTPEAKVARPNEGIKGFGPSADNDEHGVAVQPRSALFPPRGTW
jgi:hypothetical protein